MDYLYLVACITGLLLAVRLMFFGAGRRRQRPGVIPLRRSEPAGVGFLLMFGVAGYLLAHHGARSPLLAATIALLLGLGWAALVARVAILMARATPDHDPDDPRYVLQGHVGVVVHQIPAGGTGRISFEDADGPHTASARSIHDRAMDAGVEVCIERIDDGVAWVEEWSAVEARL